MLLKGQNWKIEENYEITFVGTKAEGTFRGLEGTIIFDSSDLSNASFDVSIDVATISTGNKTKDKHARGESWFAAELFPKIYFKSSKITETNSGFEVRGVLEIKGIRKEVAFPFTFEDRDGEGQFYGFMTVDRNDFGIKGNFFGFVVGDEFQVKLEVAVH